MNRSEHTIESAGGVMHRFGNLFFAEIALGCIGCALIAAAIAADQPWLDRHFLPAFFISRAAYVRTECLARMTALLLGLTLALLARRRIARALSADWTRVFATVLAILLAFSTAELVLRRPRLRPGGRAPARRPCRGPPRGRARGGRGRRRRSGPPPQPPPRPSAGSSSRRT